MAIFSFKIAPFRKPSFFLSLYCLAVFCVTLFVYRGVLNAPFLWDDEYLVESNPAIRDLDGVLGSFTQDLGATVQERWGFYRPLQVLTYAWDYFFWGQAPLGYHLTNIVLHVAAALALAYLLGLVFRRVDLACLGGLLFALHPVHTEAVAYVSGRAEILSAFFVFLALIFYIRSYSRKNSVLNVLVFLCFILALLAKENSLVFPVLCLIFHYVASSRPDVKKLVGLALVICAYLGLRYAALGAVGGGSGVTTSLGERGVGFLSAVVTYVRLLFFPFPLHMEYGMPAFSLTDPHVAFGAILLASIAACGFILRRKPVVSFGCLWFVGTLLPVSNLVPLNAYMAEHWLYLPSVGFFLIVAGLSLDAFCAIPSRAATKAVAAAAIVLLNVAYATMTFAQTFYWSDPGFFYETTLQYAATSPRIYNNLGIVYWKEGRPAQARLFFNRAIALNPGYAKAYNNLGQFCREAGDLHVAVALYQKAIALKPGYAGAYSNLCRAYADMGRYESALSSCLEAVRLDPGSSIAANNLGSVYYHMGDALKAREFFMKAAAADFPEAEAFNNLGIMFFAGGNTAQAIAAFQASLGMKPDDVRTHNNLAAALVAAGDTHQAEVHFKKAVELDPFYQAAWRNLALLYMQRHEYELAEACYAEARQGGGRRPPPACSLEPASADTARRSP